MPRFIHPTPPVHDHEPAEPCWFGSPDALTTGGDAAVASAFTSSTLRSGLSTYLKSSLDRGWFGFDHYYSDHSFSTPTTDAITNVDASGHAAGQYDVRSFVLSLANSGQYEPGSGSAYNPVVTAFM